MEIRAVSLFDLGLLSRGGSPGENGIGFKGVRKGELMCSGVPLRVPSQV